MYFQFHLKSYWKYGAKLFFVFLFFAFTHCSFTQNLFNSGDIINFGLLRVKNNVIGLDSSIGGTFEFFGSNQQVPTVQYRNLFVTGNGINIGIITDIGYACKQVIRYFSKCHAAFLEANYCEEMLANGSYPPHLKKRIGSDEGHLSNTQALKLFMNYRSKDLRLLILSHLSKNNNNPKLVEKIFSEQAGNTRIVVASRYKESPVFCVEPHSITGKSNLDQRQLTLF